MNRNWCASHSLKAMIKKLYRFLNPKFQTLFLEYKVDLKPRYGHGMDPHPELDKIISSYREDYVSWLENSIRYKENLCQIRKSDIETDPTKASWNNGFLPGLDIVSLYTMIAESKPKKYIEIGSGNSTKVAHKAIMDNDLSTEIISIDPQPRAEIDDLANKVYRQSFESLDINLVDELEENDILFIDNSHRILPNSDATVFFMDILPNLKKGVIVQIHDIYLPYDYPQFMCDRFYSEQYGLAFYLLANPNKYKCMLPNFYVSEDPMLSTIIEPLWEHQNLEGVETHGGSFWLKIAE